MDYRSVFNPLDLTLHIMHLRYIRKIIQSKTLKGLSAIEVASKLEVQSDKDIEAYVGSTTTQSHMYPYCTTVMMPREKEAWSVGINGT